MNYGDLASHLENEMDQMIKSNDREFFCPEGPFGSILEAFEKHRFLTHVTFDYLLTMRSTNFVQIKATDLKQWGSFYMENKERFKFKRRIKKGKHVYYFFLYFQYLEDENGNPIEDQNGLYKPVFKGCVQKVSKKHDVLVWA